MGHVTAEAIQAALDSGKPVWSRVFGRVGRIVSTSGRTVDLRSGAKGKGQLCVTWFDRGDDCRLTEYESEWVLATDWSAVVAEFQKAGTEK